MTAGQVRAVASEVPAGALHEPTGGWVLQARACAAALSIEAWETHRSARHPAANPHVGELLGALLLLQPAGEQSQPQWP